MEITFYIAAAVAIIATVLVITELHAVHALLYFIVSLLAAALAFYVLGATFVAALEVIIYAGAIMVLFLFLIMMLSLGPGAVEQEGRWLSGRAWVGPGILVLVLFTELVYVLAAPAAGAGTVNTGGKVVAPQEVGIALFGPYALGVEMASMLLMAGLVGAYHLGRREPEDQNGSGARGV
ncbi:MAG: NADH-quinone oxidoreductase subunit J [Chloroflexota bacterium]